MPLTLDLDLPLTTTLSDRGHEFHTSVFDRGVTASPSVERDRGTNYRSS
jgi:hypothetical protein